MKLNKRAVVLLVSLVVLLTVAAGVTVAFIIDGTNGIENIFTPSRVDCEVVPTINDTARTYAVRNTGDTEAYIRVAVLVNWISEDGIYAQAPQFSVQVAENWIKGKDGYYYYKKALAKDDVTATNLTVTVTPGTAPSADYTLSVEVVASAVQATATAVNNWSDGVAIVANGGADLQVTPMQ